MAHHERLEMRNDRPLTFHWNCSLCVHSLPQAKLKGKKSIKQKQLAARYYKIQLEYAPF